MTVGDASFRLNRNDSDIIRRALRKTLDDIGNKGKDSEFNTWDITIIKSFEKSLESYIAHYDKNENML